MTVSIERIRAVVAAKYGISVGELIGPRRDYTYLRPRHIAIYLACTLTPHSRNTIGRLFGNRDHSTIYHAQWKTTRRRAADREFDQVLRALEAELQTTPVVREEIQLAFLIGPLFDRPAHVPAPKLRMLEAA